MSEIDKYIANMFFELYEEIKHGDEEHQRWLKEKMMDFVSRKIFLKNKDEQKET